MRSLYNCTIAAVLLLACFSTAFGQRALEIEGPTEPVGYSEIAEVVTNVEITTDGEGLPSHTIEFDIYPRE